MSDLDEIAAAGEQTSATDLAAVSALAMRQLELEAEVASIEAKLKDAKARLQKVQDNDLPAALQAAKMKTFQLENGMTVSYTEDLKVSVPKARKAAVIAKMREWGHEGKVSAQIVADLGRDNDNAAKALLEQAKEMGIEAVLTEDVPTGSVKSVLNARRKDGKSDDLAFFGAFQFTRATVK